MNSPVSYIYAQSNISWKGKTFKQITSSIRKNKKIDTKNDFDVNTFFKPMPLSIYRKDKIAKYENDNCSTANYKISSSIDELNMPGGCNIIDNNENGNGLDNTLDINLPNNLYTPTLLNVDDVQFVSSSSVNNCLSQESNARKRVRSSGMIRKKISDDGTSNVMYCTNTSQYLQSRTKSFDTNQYNYIRQGSPLVKPGDSLSKSNIYTSNTTTQCPKYKLVSDAVMQYQWVDGTIHDVIIPAGRYSIEDFDQAFKTVMLKNTHYYVDKQTKTSVFLLSVSYNTSNNTIEIQSKPTSIFLYSNLKYDIPLLPWNNYPSWNTPFTTLFPCVIINDINITAMIGIEPGNYPPNLIQNNFGFISQTPVALSQNEQFYVAISSQNPMITPKYVKIFYKPNNSQFATQGAVSSSSLITRLKYDTINDAAFKTNNILNSGTATMNALAYGGPDATYTIKNKKGFPIKNTPVISKYTGELCSKATKKLSNMI